MLSHRQYFADILLNIRLDTVIDGSTYHGASYTNVLESHFQAVEAIIQLYRYESAKVVG